jgi:hypothetical protein
MQTRPASQSASAVQPTTHALVVRSQYDSLGHGHVLGRFMHVPLTQTWFAEQPVHVVGAPPLPVLPPAPPPVPVVAPP